MPTTIEIQSIRGGAAREGGNGGATVLKSEAEIFQRMAKPKTVFSGKEGAKT